jgi:hypothetical protein
MNTNKLTDTMALNLIAEILRREAWALSDLGEIADIVASVGRDTIPASVKQENSVSGSVSG